MYSLFTFILTTIEHLSDDTESIYLYYLCLGNLSQHNSSLDGKKLVLSNLKTYTDLGIACIFALDFLLYFAVAEDR